MPRKDQKKAKNKKEVGSEQQQELNRFQRQQEESKEESKVPPKQQTNGPKVTTLSDESMQKFIQQLKNIKKGNDNEFVELFPVAINSMLILQNNMFPEQQKLHTDLYTMYIKDLVGNLKSSNVNETDLINALYEQNKKTFEVLNIPKSLIANSLPKLMKQYKSEEIIATPQKVVKSANIGDKQEDNYQLQFMNEIVRYLTTVKDGINQNQLQSLSNGLFNPVDIKKRNVIDSNNIDQFKKRFMELLKNNPQIQKKFIDLTPMFQKTIIDRIRKSQQQPDKKQQQEQQLNDVVSQLSQSTLSQQSSRYEEENKSQGSGFSSKLNSSIQSNPILNASLGQVTESDRSMSDNLQFMQNPSAKGSKISQANRSLASQEYDAFQELPEKIDVLNNTMSKSDKMRLSKRHLQSIHNSSYTQAVGSNNGMNMSQGSVNRLNREVEVQNSSIVPSNNSINTFVNHGVIPQNPNPLAHEHDIESDLLSLSHRLSQASRRLGLPSEYSDRLADLPRRLLQAQQQANVQAEQAEVRMNLSEEAEQSRFSSNQQLQGSGIANMSAGNIVAQRDQTETEQTRSLNAIVNNRAFGESVQNLINRSNLTPQQQSLASRSLSAENILPNLIASSSSQLSQSRSRSQRSDSESDASQYLRLIPNMEGVALGDLNVDRLLSEFMAAQGGNRSSRQSLDDSDRSSRGMLDDFSKEILSADENMQFDFANLGVGGGVNPFEAWADYVNSANNQTVVQGDPAQPKFKMPKIAITAGDLAKYITQAVKFISEISGPISSVILATYKKQTSVFKGKVEKKETTKFKVKPGAMFRLRCCD